MKKSNTINELKRPALEFPIMNLKPNQIKKTITSEKNNGSMIFSSGSSCMLCWNKNNIGTNEKRKGCKITLFSNCLIF